MSNARISANRQTGRVYVDASHCGGRHVTGIERITLELFSEQALAPIQIETVTAGSKVAMVLQQYLGLPFRLLMNRKAIVLTPGFPPSLFLTLAGKRVIPYIHDLFLLTRRQDLSTIGKYYMAPAFRFALQKLPVFLVNSEATRDELRGFCRADARIFLYRPAVRNVFGLDAEVRQRSGDTGKSLKLIALGTVEPRKNLIAAAQIVSKLRAGAFPAATLDIVGRFGWGPDAEALAGYEGVTLHGYKPADDVKALVDAADMLICTSHDEGLGLPLLEAQYAGMPVVAPDQPVFRQVLGTSGTYINPSDIEASATRIADITREVGWRTRAANNAADNLLRWNMDAEQDRLKIIKLLSGLVIQGELT